MEQKTVTILRGNPTIVPVAEMQLVTQGIEDMMEWVGTHRPECLPDEHRPGQEWLSLFPHGGVDEQTARELTANEMLVELAGRKCYDSFGLKAGRKSNKEYIENTQAGDVPHASIMYHAKMSFFIAGVSRRVSHELIRNYVGADRTEEGNPSQESTRFTHHYGYFVCPPRYITELPEDAELELHFKQSMQCAYDAYLRAVAIDCAEHERQYREAPKGMDKKRIYEAASSFLPHQAETSFIWTTNPAAIAKFVRERDNPLADLEIQRFARTWKALCVKRWPNLFPQPYMHTNL
jgi:thymidylate synthase (FAD)